MKIAVSVDENRGLDSRISHHFGRCPYYVLVDMNGDNVQNVQVVENPYFQQHSPGMVPGFINELGVNVMLSGGMGHRAISFFDQFGIQVATGASGTVQSTLNSYLNGELQGAAPCKDHDEGHAHGDCGH